MRRFLPHFCLAALVFAFGLASLPAALASNVIAPTSTDSTTIGAAVITVQTGNNGVAEIFPNSYPGAPGLLWYLPLGNCANTSSSPCSLSVASGTAGLFASFFNTYGAGIYTILDGNQYAWTGQATSTYAQIAGTLYQPSTSTFSYGGGSIASSTSSTFAFLAPTDGNTFAVDTLISWQLSTAGLPTSTAGFSISYSRLSSSTFDYTDIAGGSTYGGTVAFPISQQLLPVPLAPPVEWWAQGKALASDGTVLASTPVITFYVVLPSSTTPIAYPTSSDCVSVPSFWTNPFGNNVSQIENGICIAFIVLFIPSSPQQADIGAHLTLLGSTVSKKPPFGYVSSAITAFSSFGESTSTSSTLADPTTTVEIYTITGSLDAGLAVVITFMLLLWIFNRARNFEPT